MVTTSKQQKGWLFLFRSINMIICLFDEVLNTILFVYCFICRFIYFFSQKNFCFRMSGLTDGLQRWYREFPQLCCPLPCYVCLSKLGHTYC